MKKTLLILAVATISLACSNGEKEKELRLEQTNITLNAGQSEQINVRSGDKSGIRWTSGNEYVATISDAGKVKAEKVGTTTVYANTVPCQVTVSPLYSTYKEPLTDWGMSRAAVKQRFGTPFEELEYGMSYLTGGQKSPLEAYIFENDRLVVSMAYVHINYYQELFSFLEERYVTAALGGQDDEWIALLVDANEVEDVKKIILIIPMIEQEVVVVGYEEPQLSVRGVVTGPRFDSDFYSRFYNTIRE